jgi:hypothetical protein
MKFKLQIVISLSLLFITKCILAQTDLSPGDIAIIGFNSSTWDNPSCASNNDNFSFVPLVDIDAGTIVYFTDCGVKANGCLRDSEGVFKYTAPAGGVYKGTITSIDTRNTSCNPNIIRGSGTIADMGVGAGFDLNVSGEQIIVFQDADGIFPGGCIDDEYIFAFTNNETWQADATSSHTSALPPGLTDGVTAVALPKISGAFQNNAVFDCSKVGSGTKEAILLSVSDYSNWLGSSGTVYDLPDCIFSFGGLEIKYITYNQMLLTWTDPGSTDEMIILVKQGAAITADPNGNDGSAWSASTVFGSGSNIGDNTYIIYKDVSVAPDTVLTLTGLTEGNDYYFKIFSHIIGSTSWVEGDGSSSSFKTAQVQDVTNESIALAGTKTITATWNNYMGNPQTDWWDGGTMIIGKAGSAVGVTRADLNGQSNSVSDYTTGTNISAYGGNFTNCFVAGLDNSGTPGGTENLALSNIEVCKTYYFKIFHNDGDVTNDDRWSDGIDLGSVSTLCPEMKVEGNSIEIVDGDVTPALIDFTDYGSIMENTNKTTTFTIKNSGTGDLTLTGGTPVTITGSGFSVTAQPTSPVTPGGSNTLQVRFTAPNNCAGGPTYTATVSIANDDTDENPYTFAVQGACTDNCTSLSPVSGTEGTTVYLTGSGFTGSTTVSFNGTPASVVSWTATQLEVKVPTGATTGTVTTASPTYNSCNVFTVIAAAGRGF